MPKTVEFWSHAWVSDPRKAGEAAGRMESDGWDGAVVVDSQCLRPELWSILTLCALGSTKLKLSPGATNPITRHPSVTAAAAATLQLISNGRAHLGIGRGDSALAHVGAAPMEMKQFEHYLSILQTYLKGEYLDLAEAASLVTGARRDFDKLAVAGKPRGSRINWLDASKTPKVPLDAYVTGPKAIEAGVRTADNLVFGVSADLDRLKWAVETAWAAAETTGRDPASLGLAAYFLVVPHPDQAIARKLAGPLLASTSRFSVMNKAVVGPATTHQRETLENIARVYDMDAHGAAGPQMGMIDAEFTDQMAVVGPASKCIDRLQAIMDLGFDRLITSVPPASNDGDSQIAYNLMTTEVLPALRR